MSELPGFVRFYFGIKVIKFLGRLIATFIVFPIVLIIATPIWLIIRKNNPEMESPWVIFPKIWGTYYKRY